MVHQVSTRYMSTAQPGERRRQVDVLAGMLVVPVVAHLLAPAVGVEGRSTIWWSSRTRRNPGSGLAPPPPAHTLTHT